MHDTESFLPSRSSKYIFYTFIRSFARRSGANDGNVEYQLWILRQIELRNEFVSYNVPRTTLHN